MEKIISNIISIILDENNLDIYEEKYQNALIYKETQFSCWHEEFFTQE